ncbi:hypothetical protein SIN8267_01150 [Sinobacterium norvegicum]|uniref:Uncharacterized protein n=1 Tax=Sinobacterium norvegicum TaxID=1641715 RepID=A0ABM9ADH2_9GAMM|nr:hypothetical protein SIN8267_01150 [Sinobacterium norvegicum]
MWAELMKSSFEGKTFKYHQTDPKTGMREVKILEGFPVLVKNIKNYSLCL